MTAAVALGNDAQTAVDRAVARWVHTWDEDTLEYLGSLQMAGGAGWKRSRA